MSHRSLLESCGFIPGSGQWTSINVSCQSKSLGGSFLRRGFVHIKPSIAQLGEWERSLLRRGFVHIKSSITQCRALPYPTI